MRDAVAENATMAQPSSGTTLFQPALSDYIIEAFDRIQIRAPSITANHMHTAVMSANFLQSEWSTQEGPNLWKVELMSINLVQGQATYNVPANVIDVLDWYMNGPFGSSFATDIVIFPISRTEYADQPNKLQQARPTTVWWNRQVNSTITLWPVPDGNGPYVLYFYAELQQQDAALPNAATLDMPFRFFDAFAAGLAAKLAVKYPPPPPNSMIAMATMADKAWQMASDKDVEDVPLYIVPAIGYYSNNQ